MSKEHFSNDIDREREILRARPDPVSICPSHMLQKLAWDQDQRTILTGWHLTESQHKTYIKKCQQLSTVWKWPPYTLCELNAPKSSGILYNVLGWAVSWFWNDSSVFIFRVKQSSKSFFLDTLTLQVLNHQNAWPTCTLPQHHIPPALV